MGTVEAAAAAAATANLVAVPSTAGLPVVSIVETASADIVDTVETAAVGPSQMKDMDPEMQEIAQA